MKEGEWLDVIDKVSEQWWYLLETEENLAYPGQWVEFYEDEKSDPPFVLWCVTDYTPVLLERYNIFHPLPVQCFMVSKHSRWIREWENHNGRMNSSYHKVKIIRTNRGSTRDGEKEEVVFFYGKVITLGWDLDRWRWPMAVTSSIILPRPAETLLSIGPPASLGQVTNDKVILPAITKKFGHKCGILFVVARKPPSLYQFGIRQLRWMNGESELLWLAFPNNVYFASQTLANRWNTNFGIAFKHDGLDGGLPTLCMNYVELGHATLIASIGSKPFSVKKSRTNSARWLKFGISSVGLSFGPFGWNRMTRCSTKNNDMNPKWSLAFGMPFSCTLTRRGNGCSNLLRLVDSRPWLFFKALIECGVLDKFFVGETG